MNLLIAADMVPMSNNINFFKEGNIQKILGSKLNDIWNEADYKIFNLEAPITNCNNKIKKCGPHLKISPQAINGIKSMNPTLILLANNHIMDYGETGLIDTINILEKKKINYIGAGKIKEEKEKSWIIKSPKKIAIYNCCETEFSVTNDNLPGANGCDLLNIWEDISSLKKKNDYVIIIYHGGKEHYRYPSPNLQKICRKMIEYGADLIVCQHSHCIGCYEQYNKKTIIYGQGNFVFDGENNEFWNTSLILNIDILNNLKIDYIPIYKTSYGTRLANEKEKKQILYEFEKRSKEIKVEKFIEENYRKFSGNYFKVFLQRCHGDNIVYRVLNKIFFHKLTDTMYSEQSLLDILNSIECEANREMFIEGLKNKINTNNERNVL